MRSIARESSAEGDWDGFFEFRDPLEEKSYGEPKDTTPPGWDRNVWYQHLFELVLIQTDAISAAEEKFIDFLIDGAEAEWLSLI